MFDVKRRTVRLDIRQHHNLEILVILYQHHIFFFVWKCRVLSRISVICGNFWFTSLIWRNLQLKLIACRSLKWEYGTLSERSYREWFQKFKNVNLTSKTKNIESRKCTKTRNWKHYWMKIHAKRKKNLHLH